MKLSLIIPAKDESERISRPLRALYKGLASAIEPNQFEILVIVNNTTDDTIQKVEEIKSELNAAEIKIHDIGKAEGKGRAVVRGIEFAKGDIIGFIDADGSSAVSQALKLYRYMEKYPTVDATIASRYAEGSVIVGSRPLHRLFLSRLFHRLVKFLFGMPIKDSLCGLKLFRAEPIRKVAQTLVVFGWTFDVNILVQFYNYGYSVKEIPTIWVDKEQSKVDVVKSAQNVIKELFTIKRLADPRSIRPSLPMREV